MPFQKFYPGIQYNQFQYIFIFINENLNSKKIIPVLSNALGVEVVRHAVGGVGLVGSLMKVTNKGCLVGSNVSREEQEELASLLGVPVCSGTVNKGGQLVSGGILVNDFVGFVGRDCSNTEIGVVQAIFGLQMNQNAVDDMRKAFQDGFL
ncbi:Eukaryotic translation initiation factor 6 [Spironucleus salmonicida]|uniref:Eukaryotic translation initiation factor 6 n=1 Tax=Spironucleus salmonicida TaxID=348837 RepID=V6M4I7_9EUKA|nr:Eukaryotic translation initiation factor 6 [Spironucleus salmonicida]|eukprot:EST48239.1 Eukaryotic translation initiation factor 6 [Spironucleus salmonicida]